jgi:hypothetical protein
MRPRPDESWTHVFTPEAVIQLLETGNVAEISLDHDLGLTNDEGKERTGYDVLAFIEERLYLGTLTFPLPKITIHSGNVVGHERMLRALASIERLRAKR